LFNPKSEVFSPTKVDMTTRRTNHTATLLNDGTVLVTGGFSVSPNPISRKGDITYLATAELFDASASFIRTADMATARAYHTATILKDGTVLVTGGVDGTGTALETAELYH
jgi:predicted transcriptional regulator